ncbi:hypothetical protein DB31_4506 [Hyalangium minutum]|uniref:Uncharacterized protein n=1 Tax=Hyalangium minutum TaxID=394096 RepID=A0A085W058_9BACT|nr:hypothetical protein DB31_4506 [Hyalangium minutum]
MVGVAASFRGSKGDHTVLLSATCEMPCHGGRCGLSRSPS